MENENVTEEIATIGKSLKGYTDGMSEGRQMKRTRNNKQYSAKTKMKRERGLLGRYGHQLANRLGQSRKSEEN